MTQRRLSLLLLPAIYAAAAAAGDVPRDVLSVSAEPPVVTVKPHEAGRRALSLPTLEYRFDIATECDGDRTPKSLSINIADTRLALSAAKLADDARQEITLTVPAAQIAPIVVNDFCVIEDAPGDDDPDPAFGLEVARGAAVDAPLRTTLSAALSAQVSLLCGNETERNMTYVTRPLGVTLSCERPDGGDIAPDEQTVVER